MPETARLTDERLRSWLDGNHASQERLAQAIVAMDRRFTSVKPRSPMGGADGGRDLEAIFRNRVAWIAVGFVNSANDSPQQRAQITRKFKADLDRALTANPKLQAFAFVTNARLTVHQRDQWLAHGKSRGLRHTIVFDREALRIALDAPTGLASRYQFLDIPLSVAEQSAFFAQWGDQLESLITTSFESVGDRLDRLEFLQEAGQPLRDLGFSLGFSTPPTEKELAHFRAVAVLSLNAPPHDSTTITLAESGRCDAVNIHSQPRRSIMWLGDELIYQFSYVTSGPPTGIYGHCGNIGGLARLAPLRVMDLNSAWLAFFVNARAAERVCSLELRANEYVLHAAPSEWIIIDTETSYFGFDPAAKWQFDHSPATADDPWVRITTGDGPLDFSRRSPFRTYTARILDPQRSLGRD